jgi:predicted O-linked N-acetylglucosamine transferase (SPINDLY family)
MTPEALAHVFQAATRNHQLGQLKAAETGYVSVLSFQPDHPFCLQQYAMLLTQLGRVREAVAPMEKSVAIRPDIPAFWNNLGEIYRQVDRLVDSMHAFHKALRLHRLFPEAHYNLANVLKQMGRHGEAVTHYQESVRLKPDYDRAWYNLGNTLREEGRVVPAIAAYKEAVRLRPDWADAHLNFANALYDQRDLELAAHEYRRAAELKPDDPDLDDSLGNCLVAAGKFEEAQQAYRRAQTRRPGKWLRALRCEMLAPPVFASCDAIRQCRESVPGIVDRFRSTTAIDLSELHTSGAEPPMIMTYHGAAERPTKELFSAFFRERLPRFDPPPPRTERPAIGVVVTHGHEGVFSRCLGELIARLDRQKLDVKLITSRSGANVLRFMQPQANFDFFLLPDRVDHANDHLRQAGFDALLYWEIGTDSMNYFLPMLRPARVQLNCWGWPSTSGHAEVGEYWTWERLEPEDADQHFTEKLVRLRELPSFYVRPPMPLAGRDKTAFGFASEQRLYLCQQNVRKYHPDFDAVLAEILDTDSAGIIGVIADEQPTITEMLMRRLRASLKDLVDRVRIIPRQERGPYLELVAAADVVLDTPHYGGGANTVLDAVATGTPMVTWTGPYQRGRWATAINQLLDVPDLNVTTLSEYAGRACRVAMNRELRGQMHAQIKDRSQELFENDAAVREWEQQLMSVVERSRRG